MPSEAPDDDAVEIEIEGDRVEPNGRQLAVAAGEPVTLAITSDRAAELHVHSSPEQMIEVAPGESTVRLTVDTPGVVDVEEHRMRAFEHDPARFDPICLCLKCRWIDQRLGTDALNHLPIAFRLAAG